jgi:hypothetical protein
MSYPSAVRALSVAEPATRPIGSDVAELVGPSAGGVACSLFTEAMGMAALVTPSR